MEEEKKRRGRLPNISVETDEQGRPTVSKRAFGSMWRAARLERVAAASVGDFENGHSYRVSCDVTIWVDDSPSIEALFREVGARFAAGEFAKAIAKDIA